MTMPSKSKIFEHWMKELDKEGLDWSEPCCWACGKNWGGKFDLDNPKATRLDIINNWDRVPLQRCHIVARQFGGEDSPDNLYLLCSECLDKAPNTKNRDIFLDWVRTQDNFKNFNDVLMRELRNFGLEDRISEINELLRNKDISKDIFGNAGLHMNQTKGGIDITLSSIVGLISEKIKKS